MLLAMLAHVVGCYVLYSAVSAVLEGCGAGNCLAVRAYWTVSLYRLYV